ncbi:MAG: phosphomannomutase/phosphoglucomutase [Thermodesulfobacteriota bacterium]|nr:phosphomannomutase/phosphoglucomutase [Thermodesulfobacteriota bacterium]
MDHINETIFKAYDIRGIYPDEIDEDTAYNIAQAYVEFVDPKEVVLGKDVRLSSPSLWQAAASGVTDAGVNVIDIGTISTDMLYFAVAKYGYGGGITVSASHNPVQYNGMKVVREKAIPISSDTGLQEILKIVLQSRTIKAKKKGHITKRDIRDAYLKHVRSFIDINAIQPLKVVANANFGLAGEVARELTVDMPIEIIGINFTPDGSFPKGRPDPLIPENRQETIHAVKEAGADFGVAWDADADRCFFFDETGEFIQGYFITALLAGTFLKRFPGSKIIFDPRLTWANIDTVKENGGIPLINKCGHAFFKERMRREDAVFAGEMSAHYYFRDNYYADNGMIPFMMMLEILSSSGKSLSQLIKPLTNKYFISGEINREVKDTERILKEIERKYRDAAVDHMDGLSIEYSDWRFNLRPSNTEPLLRLNLEARSQSLMIEKRDELLMHINEIEKK